MLLLENTSLLNYGRINLKKSKLISFRLMISLEPSSSFCFFFYITRLEIYKIFR